MEDLPILIQILINTVTIAGIIITILLTTYSIISIIKEIKESWRD